MKPLLFLLVTSAFLSSCKKDPDPIFNPCMDEVSEFTKHINYVGEFSFCNAQPPLQSFILGTASASFLNSNTVIFNLRADSINFDTTLQFDFKCLVFEGFVSSISLEGQTANDFGNFRSGDYFMNFTGSVNINFGYPNCLTNTRFEGLSEY